MQQVYKHLWHTTTTTTTHKMQTSPHSAGITLQFPNHTMRLTHSPDLYHMYIHHCHKLLRACTHRQTRTLTHTHTCSHTQAHTHTHTHRDAHTHMCIHTTTSPPAQVAGDDHYECNFYNCAVGDLKNTTSASYRGSRPHTHQTAQGQVLVCALCAAAIGCCILDLTL